MNDARQKNRRQDGFLTVFSADVVVMPPGRATAKRTDEFRAFVKPFFDGFSLLETIVFDEIPFTTTPRTGGASVEERGKGIWVFGRSGKEASKITRAVWNTDQPAPA